jgi:hypothetical protein
MNVERADISRRSSLLELLDKTLARLTQEGETFDGRIAEARSLRDQTTAQAVEDRRRLWLFEIRSLRESFQRLREQAAS